MCPWRSPILVAVIAVAAGCSREELPPEAPSPPRFERQLSLGAFMKGNLHTHTSVSDGDSTPAQVASWYREHGYRFLALTDHNHVASEADADALSSSSFVVLPGEEVSMWNRGRQVHVCAICTRSTIGGGDFASAGEALQRAIRATSLQGGIALINHPNFDWAVSMNDRSAFRGATLIEVASGHPYARSAGDAAHPSHEALWDAALSSGIDLMGAAVDDMHHLEQCGDPEAYPGKGWVFVSAPSLDRQAICDALRDTMMYASTGPEVTRVEVRGNRYTVAPKDPSDVVEFVGDTGLLASGATSYTLRGAEQWVRARVRDARGGQAWMPAVRVTR